jgi:hypothetical protein
MDNGSFGMKENHNRNNRHNRDTVEGEKSAK